MAIAILEGAGNDFVFVTQDEIPKEQTRTQLAQQWCAQYGTNGRPRDGFVIIENLNVEEEQSFFSWDFYNCDGSSAEMCGNAARCAVLFSQLLTNTTSATWTTDIGTLNGTILEEKMAVGDFLQNQELSQSARVKLPLLNLSISEKRVTCEKTSRKGYFIDSGVPHFVIPVSEAESTNSQNYEKLTHKISKAESLAIMNHPTFAPQRTNITVLKLEPESDGSHQAASFERGVHLFTQACGTGAIAAARTLQLLKGGSSWKIKMPGDTLNVNFIPEGISLSGPCRIVKIITK